MTDLRELEYSLRKAMTYQGYTLVRNPDAPSVRQAGDGYIVIRLADAVFGSRFEATLQDVESWVGRNRLGQPSLWHGNRELPSEEEEEGSAPSQEPEMVDPRPEDERTLLTALMRFFGAVDSKYDSEARLAILREERASGGMPPKKYYRLAEQVREKLGEEVRNPSSQRS